MVSSAQQNFEFEGRPSPWAPLKLATEKLKAKHGWTKILMRSGQLKASITGEGTNAGAVIGTTKVYAKVQNDGGTIDMPAREGTNVHRYVKKGGRFLGFAQKNVKEGKRIGLIEMAFTVRAHSINIPARPFLLLQPGDVWKYTAILNHYWLTGRIQRVS